MGDENSGISITLPALNEVQNVEMLSEEIVSYFEQKNIPFEIIIVNDGSSDGTGKSADALASQYKNISVIHHKTNEGYGKSAKKNNLLIGIDIKTGNIVKRFPYNSKKSNGLRSDWTRMIIKDKYPEKYKELENASKRKSKWKVRISRKDD